MRAIERTVIWIWILFGLGACAKAGMQSSGVGNGGDLVDLFLEATRSSLQQTLALLRDGHDRDQLCRCDAHSTDPICQSLKALSDEQAGFCRDFVLESLDTFSARAEGERRTPFQVTDGRLEVSDPSGYPRPVAALTEPGPEGAIRFSYGVIKDYSPIQMLMLVGHELAHKVPLGARHLFVQDNPPLGPFDQPEGGRRFLDAVGAALASYAAAHGTVERYFGIDDYFACDVTFGDSGNLAPYTLRAARLFRGAGFSSYESRVGDDPRSTCQILEHFGESRVALRVVIHEEKGCNPAVGATESRWTRLELRRIYAPKAGVTTPAPELLDARSFPGWNPLCAPAPSHTVELSYRSGDGALNRFTWSYQRTEGRTQRER